MENNLKWIISIERNRRFGWDEEMRFVIFFFNFRFELKNWWISWMIYDDTELKGNEFQMGNLQALK